MKLDSSGLVVRVFVCVNVYVGVCSLISLFADSRLSLIPWLVGCLDVWSMCAFVFSGTCATFSCFVNTVGNIFCVCLALSGALGLHCNTWGFTLPPLLDNFAGFSYLVAPWSSIC